jgi:hypothetical protein
MIMSNLPNTESLLRLLDYPFSLSPSESRSKNNSGYENNFYQTEQKYMGYARNELPEFRNQLLNLQKLSMAELGSIKKTAIYYQTLYEIIRTVNHQITRLKSFIQTNTETIKSVTEKAENGNEKLTQLLDFHKKDCTPQFADVQLEVGEEFLKTLLSTGFEKRTPFKELVLHVNKTSEPLPLRLIKNELATLFMLLKDASAIAADFDKVDIAKFIEANFTLFDKKSKNYLPVTNMNVDLSRVSDTDKRSLLDKLDSQ